MAAKSTGSGARLPGVFHGVSAPFCWLTSDKSLHLPASVPHQYRGLRNAVDIPRLFWGWNESAFKNNYDTADAPWALGSRLWPWWWQWRWWSRQPLPEAASQFSCPCFFFTLPDVYLPPNTHTYITFLPTYCLTTITFSAKAKPLSGFQTGLEVKGLISVLLCNTQKYNFRKKNTSK